MNMYAFNLHTFCINVYTYLFCFPQDSSQFNVHNWDSIQISFKRTLEKQRDLEVAKPDFGSLLKAPHDVQTGNAGNGVIDTGPQIGTILWYNGRRKSGVLLADRDHSQLRC